MAHEVGLLVDHEEATLHPAGVASAQVGSELGAVAAGLIGAALEVPVLVEDDLQSQLQTFNMYIIFLNLLYIFQFTVNLHLTSDEF